MCHWLVLSLSYQGGFEATEMDSINVRSQEWQGCKQCDDDDEVVKATAKSQPNTRRSLRLGWRRPKPEVRSTNTRQLFTLFAQWATIEELNFIELLIIPVPFMPREQSSWAAGQPCPSGMLLLFAHDKALRMIFTLKNSVKHAPTPSLDRSQDKDT